MRQVWPLVFRLEVRGCRQLRVQVLLPLPAPRLLIGGRFQNSSGGQVISQMNGEQTPRLFPMFACFLPLNHTVCCRSR